MNTGRQLAMVEGVRNGLYGGISASLLRQASFSGLRHGLYGVFDRRWREAGLNASLSSRLTCAVAAGCIGAVVANPTDVVLVRMQADGHLPQPLKRGYRHVFHGISRICQDEGWRTLWRGCSPTVLRAALVTGSQIATYEEVRALLTHHGVSDGFKLHLACAISSATVACFVTSPVDVVKTRIMFMQSEHGSTFRGPLDCVMQTIRTEGPLAFYKGLSATFLRLWPHTVVLWLAQERIGAVLRRRDSVPQDQDVADKPARSRSMLSMTTRG